MPRLPYLLKVSNSFLEPLNNFSNELRITFLVVGAEQNDVASENNRQTPHFISYFTKIIISYFAKTVS